MRQTQSTRADTGTGEGWELETFPPPLRALSAPQDIDSSTNFGAFALMAVLGPLDLLHILLHNFLHKRGEFPP